MSFLHDWENATTQSKQLRDPLLGCAPPVGKQFHTMHFILIIIKPFHFCAKLLQAALDTVFVDGAGELCSVSRQPAHMMDQF